MEFDILFEYQSDLIKCVVQLCPKSVLDVYLSWYLNCDSTESLGAAGSLNTEGDGFCPEECSVKYETRKGQCEDVLRWGT